MGCETTKEKVEDEMVKMKLEREGIRSERYKLLKILNEIDGYHRKASLIPNYIDSKFENSENNNKNNNIKVKRRQSRSKSTKLFDLNKNRNNRSIFDNKIFNFEDDEEDKDKTDKENIIIRRGKRRNSRKRRTMKY